MNEDWIEEKVQEIKNKVPNYLDIEPIIKLQALIIGDNNFHFPSNKFRDEVLKKLRDE